MIQSNILESRYMIWPDYPAKRGFLRDGFVHGFYECPRAGGGYIVKNDLGVQGLNDPMIDELTGASVSDEEKNRIRARLTTILVDRRQLGEPLPLVTREIINEARENNPSPVHRRAERLLRFIAAKCARVSDSMPLTQLFQICRGYASDESPDRFRPEDRREFEYMLEAMAWTESTMDSDVIYLRDYLETSGWVSVSHSYGGVQVTVDGHNHIAADLRKPTTAQAFIAMWINPNTEEAFRKGLKLGIEDAGYEPLRIDQKLDVVKIDDEILAEIRKSRLLIADFTQGEGGARGGVYFEAGFALGLGIPVFFTCREDAVKKLHFDTRQYNHIVWKDPEELRLVIRDRIRARIGQGPGVNG